MDNSEASADLTLGEQTKSGQRARGELRPLSVAPMMDRSDRHFRRLMRLISGEVLLYTEMATCPAVLHGDRDHLLGYHESEHPLALQLGGDDPEQLAACTRIAAELGYDEVNLNVGCPSDRVQSGNFGACLMRSPERVAACVTAMREAAALAITVKHRIGVDELDRYEDMLNFVDVVAASGCDRFTVHARKAWLSGLSPKQNRTVPPLRYAEVHRLKRERPEQSIELNGGIKTHAVIAEQLSYVDAVMIGRAAWDDPWLFASADRRYFAADRAQSSTERPTERPTEQATEPEAGATRREVTRRQVVAAYLEHVEDWLSRPLGPRGRGPSPTILLRPLMNLFAGRPGARRWKQALNGKCQAPRKLAELLTLVDELEQLGHAHDRRRAG